MGQQGRVADGGQGGVTSGDGGTFGVRSQSDVGLATSGRNDRDREGGRRAIGSKVPLGPTVGWAPLGDGREQDIGSGSSPGGVDAAGGGIVGSQSMGRLARRRNGSVSGLSTSSGRGLHPHVSAATGLPPRLRRRSIDSDMAARARARLELAKLQEQQQQQQ